MNTITIQYEENGETKTEEFDGWNYGFENACVKVFKNSPQDNDTKFYPLHRVVKFRVKTSK